MAVSRSMLVKYMADVSNYQKGMKEIAQSTQQSKKEMQLWAAQNNVSNNSSKYLKQELLTNKTAYANLGKQINETNNVLNKAKATYGENSTQAKKYSDKLLDLQIKHAQLGNAIKDAENPLKNMSKTLDTIGSKAQKVGSFLTKYVTLPMVAAGAGVLKLATSAGEYGDTLSRMSILTGVSVKSLQEWRYAATLLDYDAESMTSTITQFTNKLRGASDGTGDTAKAFKVLQMSLTDAKGNMRPINDIFLETIDRLSKVKNETVRNTLASALFGRSFAEMLPILTAGSDKLKQLFGDANKKGFVMSDADIEKLDAFKDKWDSLTQRFQVAGAEIGLKFIPTLESKLLPFIETKLIPGIEKFSSYLGDLIKKFTELDPQVQKNILAFTGLSMAFGPVISGLGGVASGLGNIIGLLGRIPGLSSSASSALALVGKGGLIAAAAGITAWGVVQTVENLQDYKNKTATQKQIADAQAAGRTREMTAGEKMFGSYVDFANSEQILKDAMKKQASDPVYQAKAAADKAAEETKKQAAELEKQAAEYEKLFKQLFGTSASAVDKLKELRDSIKSLASALKDQTTSFANYVGLFDTFERKAVSPERLFNRLKAQVKAMSEWRTSLASLENRGVDAAFLNDLRSMGPSAVDSINALSRMSNAQLKEYTGLYDQKFSMAGSEAAKSISYEQQQTTRIDKQIIANFNNAKFTISANTANELVKILKNAGVKI